MNTKNTIIEEEMLFDDSELEEYLFEDDEYDSEITRKAQREIQKFDKEHRFRVNAKEKITPKNNNKRNKIQRIRSKFKEYDDSEE